MTPPPPFNDPKKFAIPPECEPSKVWVIDPPFADSEFRRLLGVGWRNWTVFGVVLPCTGENGWSVLIHFPKLVPAVKRVFCIERKTLKCEGKGCVILRCSREKGCCECPWLKRLDAEGFEIRGREGWFDRSGFAPPAHSRPDVRDGYGALADVYDGYKNLIPLFPVWSYERKALEENVKFLSVGEPCDDGVVDQPGDSEKQSAPRGNEAGKVLVVHDRKHTTARGIAASVGVAGGAVAVVAGLFTATPLLFALAGLACIAVNLVNPAARQPRTRP